MQKSSPWYKTTLTFRDGSADFRYAVPFDVFSTLRVDEGTELLLAHLPVHAPLSILEMGCGYGALGLPVAARFPKARLEMVDRDLLAVEAARHNAEIHGLQNVEAHGSLGFRDCHGRYDWILCNVPARIGRPFIEDLFRSGAGFLDPQGEIRVVVIRDLIPTLEAIRRESGFPLESVADGPRHAIWRMAASPSTEGVLTHQPDLYLRDTVAIGDLSLERPFDLGGDDPKRLAAALPALLDTLPKAGSPQSPKSVFVFRAGYGPLPCIAAKRWPAARICAQDRDLLATEFIRRNARALGIESARFEVRECVDVAEAMADAHYDLVLGEISPSAGARVAEAEIQAALKSKTPQGRVVLLMLSKLWREWVQPWSTSKRLGLTPVLEREGFTIVRG